MPRQILPRLYRSRLFLALALAAPLCGQARAEEPVKVFAAASLKGALTDISAAWVKLGHPKLVLALDSSGTLAKEIQQGAPAHIFFSADEKWMDYLAKVKLIVPDSRADVLTNTLVLVRPKQQAKPVKLTDGFDLAAILGPHGRLSVGDPDSVPAGIYGKQALTSLKVWDYASHHLAPAANVKGALLAVETGDAPAGIVYGTDARGDKKVAVVGTFPASSHDPITYPVALVANVGETDAARQALAFLESKQARAIYVKYGFGTK